MSAITRRSALGLAITSFMTAMARLFGNASRVLPGLRLRPPGALPEKQFVDACVSCFKCGNACPNGCIKFYGFEAGTEKAFTPYITARARGCTLCGECANACPTGAIKPFEVSREGWVKSVKMGVARVNTDMCYSYHGRTCGACYLACPLAGIAMKIGVFETPHVQVDGCVGCGLCEQACLHLPQAIRVIPRSDVT